MCGHPDSPSVVPRPGSSAATRPLGADHLGMVTILSTPRSSPALAARAMAELAETAGRGAAANITSPIWLIQSGTV